MHPVPYGEEAIIIQIFIVGGEIYSYQNEIRSGGILTNYTL
jgi:hypothetical protein